MLSDRHEAQRALVAATAIILLLAPGASADAIRLRASVRLPAGAERVRLADVAVLEGAEAQSYADLTLAAVTDSAAAIEIPIQDVRARLDEAGAHWGRINLSGNRVVARPGASATAPAPAAMQPASLAGDPDRQPRERPEREEACAADLLRSPTLRGCIARQMVQALNTDPAGLRLVFDSAEAAQLDAQEDMRRFELEPHASFESDLVPFSVRVWTAGRVTDTWSVAVRPLLRIETAVLRRDLAREEAVGAADFEVQVQWLPPTLATVVCPPAEATGLLASTRLDAGEVLRRTHLRRRNVVERGDRIMVRCLVGGIVISLPAEARADGAAGDAIEVRKLGERETFVATVSRRGEAVLDLTRR